MPKRVVAAVQRRLSEAETQQTKIEQIAKEAPGVVAQIQDLDRDYGVLKRNYMELVARRNSTEIANAADTKTERIQFRIVDAPQVPLVPVAPNRPLLVTAVLILGIGAGLAVPLLMMQFDHSFATLGQLRNLDLGKRVAAFDRCGTAACRAPADRGDRERLGPGCSIWNVALAQRRSPIA